MSFFTIIVAGITTFTPFTIEFVVYAFWVPFNSILITFWLFLSITSAFLILKLSLYNNCVSPNTTFSTSCGNWISITGFLNRLYSGLFVTSVAVIVVSFCALFVHSVLLKLISILVFASFICSSFVFSKLYFSSITSCVSLFSCVCSISFCTLFIHFTVLFDIILLLFKSVIEAFKDFLFSIFKSPIFTGFVVFTIIEFCSFS